MVTHFSGQPRVFGQRGRQLIKRLCAFEKTNSTFTRQCLFWRLQVSLCLRWCGEEKEKRFSHSCYWPKEKKSQSPNLQGSWDSVLECRGHICHHGLRSGLGDLGTRWADLFLTELFCVFERQYMCTHTCMSKSLCLSLCVCSCADICMCLSVGRYVCAYV